MQIANRKILVTGGAGFVGSHLVDRLVEMKCQVTVLDDLANGDERNLDYAQESGYLTFVLGSVEDEALVYRLVVEEGCELIFHLAALNLLRSLEDPYRDLRVSALGTLNLLRAMQESPVGPVMVYSSTGSVYGEPQYQPQDENHPLEPVSPYGISKLAAEKYVLLWHRLFDVRTVALRYYNVYGPRQDYSPKGGVVGIFINRVLHGHPPVIEGTGYQERCFTFVNDVVRANLLAATTETAWGEVYNIGTTEITTIRVLADMVLELCRSDLKPTYAPRRLGDIDMFRPDISRAEQRLGYRPTVPLRAGLQKTIAWFIKTERAPYPPDYAKWRSESASVEMEQA